MGQNFTATMYSKIETEFKMVECTTDRVSAHSVKHYAKERSYSMLLSETTAVMEELTMTRQVPSELYADDL